MSNRFFIILLATIAIFVGIFFVTKNKKTNNSPSASTSSVSNHVFGNGKSGVVLTEYGDFQCPACYQYEPLMKQVRAKYQDSIYFKFRNFPLTSLHKNAFIAARAAEAASIQGKFWEMHDLLYQNQDPSGQSGWVASSDPTSFFADFAKQLGLDVNKFLSDLQGSQTNDTVLADLHEAQGLGFDGTPSFTLNGQKFDRPTTVEGFYKVIDDAVSKSNKH